MLGISAIFWYKNVGKQYLMAEKGVSDGEGCS
jgi:hypothetical protein